MRSKRLLLISAVFLIASCGGSHPPDKAPTYVKPTATEVFHLRSECAALGEKILNKNVIGVALTQDQVSHYDPKTNRCYVQLTVQAADLSGDHFSTYLYDGQTGEMLATASSAKGKKTGIVYGVSPPDGSDPDRFWNQADDYINEKMKDDRTD